MLDFIGEYTGRLFSNPLFGGAVIASAAALILLPQFDEASPEERFLGIFGSPVPTQEQLEESQMPWKRELARLEKEADEFARLSTEADMRDPRTTREFLIEYGYTREQRRGCRWLETPEAERLLATAGKYGVGEVAYGLPSRESDYRQFDANGKALKSRKGAVGKLQVLGTPRDENGERRKNGGFNEVWHMFNEPLPHQRRFIKEYREAIEEDSHLLCGDEDEVYEGLHTNERANEIAGFAYIGFLKFINNGDINLALEMYVAGADGRKRSPNSARRYMESVLARQEKWQDLKENICPQMERASRAFKERRYKWHKSNYLSANQWALVPPAHGETNKRPPDLFYPASDPVPYMPSGGNVRERYGLLRRGGGARR